MIKPSRTQRIGAPGELIKAGFLRCGMFANPAACGEYFACAAASAGWVSAR
jgi:hypothetical protein